MTSQAASSLAARVAVRARSPVGVGLAGKLAEGVALCLFITVLPRALGPDDFGRLALALAVVQIASASMTLGGPSTVSRFVPAQEGPERAAVARLLVRRMAQWRIAVLLVVAVVATGFAIAVPDRVPPGMAVLLLLAITLDGAAVLLAQADLGLGRSVLWSYRIPLQTTVIVVAALCLAPAFGAWGAAAAVVVATGVSAIVAAFAVVPSLRRVRPARSLPPGLGRFAVLQGVNGFLALCMTRGGVVAVAWLHPSAVEVGYAGLATGIAMAGVYAVAQAFVVQLPGLAALATLDLPAAEARGRRLARAGALVLAPGTVVLAAVLGPLLVLLAGEEYRPAIGAAVLALAMVPLAPVTALVAQAASLRLRPELTVMASAVGAIAFLLVVLTAVDPYGAEGASAAMVAGMAVTALAGAALTRAVPRLVLGLAAAAALAICGLALIA